MDKNRLAHAARKMPPSTRKEIDRLAKELKDRAAAMTKAEAAAFDKQLDVSFPGGFTHRDEANALIALAVRNGPIEDLHAGARSPLLEDDSLSRITDDEMRILMINATRALTGLLRLRDSEPELYRRYIQTYGTMYCQFWEREE